MEDRVTIGVPEDEMRPSEELLLGLVALEPLAVRGEVVEDPAGGLWSELPGPGGQVHKVFLLGNISTSGQISGARSSYSFPFPIASTLLYAEDLIVVQDKLQLIVQILEAPVSIKPKVGPFGNC